MAATTPTAARRDLFDLLASDWVKGTPNTDDLERVYAYEVSAGTQVRSTKGVLSIRAGEQTDASEFSFVLTIYTDMTKGPTEAEAAMDTAWWAVETLLDDSGQFTRGLWSEPFVADGLQALVRQSTVTCSRAGHV